MLILSWPRQQNEWRHNITLNTFVWPKITVEWWQWTHWIWLLTKCCNAAHTLDIVILYLDNFWSRLQMPNIQTFMWHLKVGPLLAPRSLATPTSDKLRSLTQTIFGLESSVIWGVTKTLLKMWSGGVNGLHFLMYITYEEVSVDIYGISQS